MNYQENCHRTLDRFRNWRQKILPKVDMEERLMTEEFTEQLDP